MGEAPQVQREHDEGLSVARALRQGAAMALLYALSGGSEITCVNPITILRRNHRHDNGLRAFVAPDRTEFRFGLGPDRRRRIVDAAGRDPARPDLRTAVAGRGSAVLFGDAPGDRRSRPRSLQVQAAAGPRLTGRGASARRKFKNNQRLSAFFEPTPPDAGGIWRARKRAISRPKRN